MLVSLGSFWENVAWHFGPRIDKGSVFGLRSSSSVHEIGPKGSESSEFGFPKYGIFGFVSTLFESHKKLFSYRKNDGKNIIS